MFTCWQSLSHTPVTCEITTYAKYIQCTVQSYNVFLLPSQCECLLFREFSCKTYLHQIYWWTSYFWLLQDLIDTALVRDIPHLYKPCAAVSYYKWHLSEQEFFQRHVIDLIIESNNNYSIQCPCCWWKQMLHFHPYPLHVTLDILYCCDPPISRTCSYVWFSGAIE